ncbi:MAG TPA: TRAP transporter substrate-binding protein [Steroidobacteraceae bacterium]|nr:TRAP transporter substrate-binding protein [Steroidobacteraceae bacterium]
MLLSRRHCLTSFAALAAGGSRIANAMSAGVLTSADVHPKGYPTVEAVRFVGERLEKETGGRLKINVYYAGQLGREPDTVDLARLGAIDIARVNFAALNNAFPLTQVFSLPYVFDSVEHMRRAVDGKIGSEVLEGFAKRDLIGLCIYDAGMRCIYNVRRPVAEPKDLHGLKIRVPASDIFIELMRVFGANPTPLPLGDVYSGMQTHLMDGAENNWRTFHSSRHFEVAKYWSNTEHSHSPEALLMSRKTFEALSNNDRELLLTAARDSVPYMRNLWDRMNNESRETVLRAGVKAVDVNRAAFHAAVHPVVQRYLARNDLHEMFEAIRALA